MAFTTVFLAGDGGSPEAPAYTAEQIRLLVDNMFTAGVLGSGFAVSQRAAGANTSVDITAGAAVVEGPSAIGSESRYLVEEPTATTNTGSIGSAPGSNFRNDIVGVYVNDPDAPGSGDTTRVAEFKVIAGSGHTPATPAGTPYGATGDPALPGRFLALARVRWSAGMVSITNGQIDDLRAYATLARDVVDDAQATRLGTASVVNGAIIRRSASTGSVAFPEPTSSDHPATRNYVDVADTGTSGSSANTRWHKSGAKVSVWTTGGGSTPVTIAAGYRPAAAVTTVGFAAGAAFSVTIATTGAVTYSDGAPTAAYSVSYVAA